MRRKSFYLSLFTLLTGLAGYLYFAHGQTIPGGTVAADGETPTQGALIVLDGKGGERGFCPLKHTDVKAEVSGFLARVTVTQEFHNPNPDKIEAVYTFPLPQNAAVDDMTMLVGDRTVRGKIKKREEAQAIFDAARNAGYTASLLDQERPNIFTQSVTNIAPGQEVKIVISYVETLKYEDGKYKFVFPMVVGPRYVPGQPISKQAGGFSPDTTQVPDASRITPNVVPRGMRAGHDISLDVTLDAGVPLQEVRSTSHEIEIKKPNDPARSTNAANIVLKKQNVIPNKDFILEYDVAGGRIEDAMLTHRDERGGFFTLMLQPPDRVTPKDVTPKELVFVLDTSGSMEGFPIEKAKETMKLALDGLYPGDTFNLITFAGDTYVLFPEPVPATAENLRKAQQFLESRQGGGGTEMMKAIRTALDPSDRQNHLRIVCFMTDGYVGNDMEIVSEIQKHQNARVFSFGIGGSVNRFLLDKMSEAGRGEVEYVALNDDGSAAARRFHERVRNPLMTDIDIDWGGLPVTDVYPKRIPDLFSAKPVIVHGRFTGSATGTIKLKGKMGGREANIQAVARTLNVTFPDSEPRHDVLATLWARTKIDDLMQQDFAGIQQGGAKPEVKEAITQLGLDYRLMTQFTSFVAVEEMTVTDGGTPRRIDVPVEMPEGVSHKGVFGEEDEEKLLLKSPVGGKRIRNLPAPPPVPKSAGAIGGIAYGRGSNSASQPSVSSDEVVAVTSAPVTKESRRRADKDVREVKAGKKNESDQVAAAAPNKLHPALAAVVERLKQKKAKPTAEEAKFVADGKAELQVWLTDKSAETMAELKKLGFEIVAEPKSGTLLIGRLPLESLAKLIEVKGVRYVSPVTR